MNTPPKAARIHKPFPYTPAVNTDIRRTFDEARRKLGQSPASVVRIVKKGAG